VRGEDNKVLVTGVAGFIGRHVAQHCLDFGFKVVGIDDLSEGFLENIPQGVEFIKGDVGDSYLIKQITEKYRFDYIYHLAGFAAEGLSHFVRRYNYTANLLGSINLINAAVRTKVKCFIYTSSVAVYGSQKAPFHEEMVPLPKDPYGISKYAVEMDLKAAREVFGLNFIIFRPHDVYGEYQNFSDPYRNVVGIFINRLLENEPITVVGDGLQTRAFSYIGDVAPIIAESPRKTEIHNQIFNIGSDERHTILELAQVVAKCFGVRPEIVHLDPRKEAKHTFLSHEKLKKYFGERKMISLEEGVHRMVQWARTKENSRYTKFKDIEIFDNLPPAWKDKDVKP